MRTILVDRALIRCYTLDSIPSDEELDIGYYDAYY
jgi:hypothetical protein